MNAYTAIYKSPLGAIEIVGTRDRIVSLEFADQEQQSDVDLPFCLKDGLEQIDEYFSGERKDFSLRLDPPGTEFQKSVWRQLEKVPYGSLTSYGKIAAIMGKPTASRAVGSANGKNPIAIIIPCHRVVASDGNLTGYGGGLWRKEWLIRHEKDFSNRIF
jgi:methylated-DNA-[protein]-cysteine S-methyltransferase